MKLSSIINKRLIFGGLQATSIEGVVAELMGKFFNEMGLDVTLKQSFVDAVLMREKQGGTAFGNAVAFPHARIAGFDDFAIVVGISKDGVECNSLDGKKVHIFFLILTGKTKNAQLLRALASIAELVDNKELWNRIVQSNDPHVVHDLIEESDVDFKKSMTAEDIMISETICARPDHTMKEVSDILFNNNITGVPVVDANGILVGELTEKELIKVGLPASMSLLSSVSFIKDFEPFEKYFEKEDQIRVKDILNTDVSTIAATASIVEVAFLCVHKKRRRLYVVNKDKKLIGVIMRHAVLMRVLHP